MTFDNKEEKPFIEAYKAGEIFTGDSRKEELVSKLVAGCIETGIIDEKTKISDIKIDCVEDSDETIAFLFSTEQAGKRIRDIRRFSGLSNITARFVSLKPIFEAKELLLERISPSTVRLSYESKSIDEKLAKPLDYSWTSYEDRKQTGEKKDKLYLGQDALGREVWTWADPSKVENGVVTGVSGSGKTQGLRLLLAELAQTEAEAIICDPTMIDFCQCASRFTIVDDEKLFTETLERFYSEMMRRVQWIKEHSGAKLPDDGSFPQCWLIINDYEMFVFDENAKSVKENGRIDLLTRITALSYKVGMPVVVSSQTFDPKIITSRLRNNLEGFRMVFRTNSPTHTKLSMPEGKQTAAHRIPFSSPGQCYYITVSTENLPVEGRTRFITGEQLLEVCEQYAPYHKTPEFIKGL